MKTFQEYQDKLREMQPGKCAKDIPCCALGIVGEAGEVADLLKKVLYHGKPLDVFHLREELGDVLWYLTSLAELHNLNLDDIAKANVEKLTKRYPNGFHTPVGVVAR